MLSGVYPQAKSYKNRKIIQCDSLLPFVDAIPVSAYIWLLSSPFKCNYLKNFLRVYRVLFAQVLICLKDSMPYDQNHKVKSTMSLLLVLC